MPTDYDTIARQNVVKYGTDVDDWGPMLLAQLYSDRTHFVYELLQNAEDALRKRADAEPGISFPRAVRFSLFHDRLELRHHGIPFDERFVRGICGIGKGTKHNDLTTIGRFGIGFKSVYAYTASPCVHSGDEHFVIRSYVQPHATPLVRLGDGETLFVLPFDAPEVPPSQAYEEIAGRLRELEPRTLLFLHEIDGIDWSIDGAENGSYQRRTETLAGGRRVTLAGLSDLGETAEAWMAYERSIEVPGEPTASRVEVAYLLEGAGRGTRVKPVPNAPLVVFFPTEKETHLGALIQGPYRTTPARDNIPKEDAWNWRLIAETSHLLVDSLEHLKAAGLLDVRVLQAMPIKPAAFPTDGMFRPLYDAVLKALANRDLLPTSDGKFVSAEKAKLARGTGLRELLGPAVLRRLFKADVELKWLTGDLTPDRTPDLHAYLVGELGVEEVTPASFASVFDANFIAAQSDSWVRKLYAFLAGQEALLRPRHYSWEPEGSFRHKPFIRLQDGTHVMPFSASGTANAYLPGPEETEFPTVRRQLVKDKKALDFLKKLGLREPDIVDAVFKDVIPQYERKMPPGLSRHKMNLTRIIRASRTDSASKRQELLGRLQSLAFVRCTNLAGQVTFRSAADAYFRTPDLERYFAGNPSAWFVEPLHPDWTRRHGENFASLCRELGAVDVPRLLDVPAHLTWDEKVKLHGGEGHTSDLERTDRELDGLDHCLGSLASGDVESATNLSMIIWQFLLRHANARGDDGFQGVYRWLYYKPRRANFVASFVKKLRHATWLPRPLGGFCKPGDVVESDLPESYERHRVLKAFLGFRPEVINVLAEQAGIDPKWLTLVQQYGPEFADFLEQKRQRGESGGPTANGGSDAGSGAGEAAGKDAGGSRHPQDNGQERERRSGDSGSNRGNGDGNGIGDHDGPPNDDSDFVDGSGNRTDSGDRQGRRLLTYTETLDGEANHQSDDAISARGEVQREGELRAMEFEMSAGRSPVNMNSETANYPGYDIESSDATGGVERYIEVKSVSDGWGITGVGLTGEQFRKALELGDRYWLYVVESPFQPGAPIARIQDPARLVGRFMYDHGWRGLAEAH